MRRAARLALGLLALAAAPLASATLAPAVSAQPAPTTYVVRPGDTLFRISRATGVSVAELRRLNGLTSDLIETGQALRLTALVPLPPRPPAGADGTPAAPTPRATGPARTVHVVQPGETLYSIARRYSTSVDDLRRLNGIVGDNVAAGRRLTVPAAAAGLASAPPATPRAADPEPGGPAAPPPVTAPVSAPVTAPAAATVTPPITLGPWRIDRTTVPADLVHFVDPGETLYSIAVRYGFASDQLAALNPLTTAPLEPGTLLVLPEPVDPSVPHEVALPPVDTVGLALVYDDAFAGRATASGELYAPEGLTAAHRALPFGTVLLVTNTASGRSVFVRVNDRGPVSTAYLVELSAAAAAALELDPDAARRVELRRLP
jgi:LysM repeat protein